MLRILTALTLLAATAPASAQTGGVANIRVHLAQELPIYGFRDVDVSRLSSSQVLQIEQIIHSGREDSNIRSRIATVIEGGLLQRLIFGERR
ncbi:hypothetical protein [Jannaschia ovalis]|uniref:POTRA domain-containing protein n=1 Tax=Jannaschia ovalis TaxID=3038773 RepID=A0ABY8LHK0_9RHOB|nr:hypothetical protein [Jannaschia sp. GRR-S6-38]WGH79830.1 hypothetical protein P8627_06095 [Jannaschia sp. GRR-S6-38]